jgi:hypothetical protein
LAYANAMRTSLATKRAYPPAVSSPIAAPRCRSVEDMQFSPDLREAVAAGDVTVSVRLWSRPKVRVGGRYPVAGAVIEVTSVELLPFSSITGTDVRECGESDREALRTRAAHAGPVTDDTLVYRIEFRVVEPAT